MVCQCFNHPQITGRKAVDHPQTSHRHIVHRPLSDSFQGQKVLPKRFKRLIARKFYTLIQNGVRNGFKGCLFGSGNAEALKIKVQQFGWIREKILQPGGVTAITFLTRSCGNP